MLVNGRLLALVVLSLYFFSGFVGLAYEMLWVRMLSTLFGVSIFGVVITVAAFMAGLGTGSLIGHRYRCLFKRPLWVFAGIEISVALYAFLLPSVVQALDGMWLLNAGSITVDQWHFYQAIAAFSLIFLPAMALGLAFPFMVRYFTEHHIPLSIVYGVNTLGGVLGALCPLLLLPVFGWNVALKLMAILGFMIGAMALVMGFRTNKLSLNLARLPPQSPWNQSLVWSVLAYAMIGAAALMLQVAWTRLFGMVLLRTEYVLGVIVASVLLGMAGGSLVAKAIHKAYWFMVLPMFAAMGILLTLWFYPTLAAWADSSNFDSLEQALLKQGLALVLLTLPVTLVFGAWLPFLAKKLGGDDHVGAVFYGANSLGAAGGALLAGFVLTPLIGSTGIICVAAGIVLLASLVWVKKPLYYVVIAVYVVAVVPVWSLPPVMQLLPGAYAKSTDLFYREDAISMTHVVEQADGQRVLMADLQRLDASTEPSAVAVQKNQARLPLLLAGEAKSVLFLGLGTGISATGSMAYPGLQRTAVELSQGAIIASQSLFKPYTEILIPHLTVIHDDARRFLKVDKAVYDVIIGDLFHPDLVGRSYLLSLEQFQRAKQRLSDSGIFVQWIAVNQFDLKTFKIVLRTFQHVFPQAVLFLDGFRVALVGPKQQLRSMSTVLAYFSENASIDKVMALGGEDFWTWYGRYWGPIALKTGSIQTEWSPVIEFALPAARYQNKINLEDILKFMLALRPSPVVALQQLNSEDNASLDDTIAQNKFESAYLASEMLVRSWLATFQNDTSNAHQLIRMAYEANPVDRWIAFDLADKMYASIDQAVLLADVSRRDALLKILQLRSDHVASLKSLWRLEKEAGNTQQALLYFKRLKVISPFDRALALEQKH